MKEGHLLQTKDTEMQRINWMTAVFLIVTPIVALSWGGVHVALAGVSALDVGIFLFYLAATNMSVTAGYHRLFAHRAYECRRVVKLFYLLFGAATFQHSVLSWASDHRRHHQHIDRDGDPYNIRRGFFWAHIGWLLVNDHKPERFGNVPDLVADPLVRFQHRFYMPIAIVMGFGLPLAVGAAIGHPWGCLLWAGVIRTVVGHHSTFLVNSLAHTLGTRPYSLAVSARDSVVTALLTFGEGYHNFHHRFAADYRNGVRRYQWDPTKWLIRGMAATGCAWNLRRAPRERIVAAQLQCDTQRLLERMKGASEQAVSHMRERISEIAAAVHRAAVRLGGLERELTHDRRGVPRRRISGMRAELRAARRELREARRRWSAALAELQAQPQPLPA
jgi:stearoyl-CoA desaturase (delta-9 desaturase)